MSAQEPAARTYVYLCWNLALNGVPVLDEGAFREGRAGVLPLHAGATANGRNVSIAMDPRYSKNAQTVDTSGPGHRVVRTVALPAYLAGLGAAAPLAVLKLDCEGCEFEVLPELERSGVLARAGRVVGELHARRDEPRYREYKAKLCTTTVEGPALRVRPALPRAAMSCFERHLS